MNSKTKDGTAFSLTGLAHAPTMTLIHGLGLCKDLWAPFLAEFEEHFQVLTYDLYGHGQSGPVPETASLTVYARQIANLMNHLEINKTALVGFSIGGMINRRFAMDYPGKLSTLAILNSPHDRGSEGQQAVEERAKKVREEGGLSTLPAALERWFTPEYREGNGAGLELVRKWREQTDSESYAQAAWVLANGVRELIQPKQNITAPTLVMTCENDSGSTPAMSEAIAEEISGSEIEIVSHLKHLGLMEKPERFSEPVIRFLKNQLHEKEHTG